MATLHLKIPDGNECAGCRYRLKCAKPNVEEYHCLIFCTDAVTKCGRCLESSTESESEPAVADIFAL